MTINWTTALQIIACNYFIVTVAAVMSRFKFFALTDGPLILHITDSVLIPLAIFRETGIHPLTPTHWLPFFATPLTQATIHIFCIVYAIVRSNYGIEVLKFLTQTVYSNILYFGLPIVEVAVDTELAYTAVQCAMVELLFIRPGHLLWAMLVPPSPPSSHGEEELTDEDEDGFHASAHPIIPVTEPNAESSEAPTDLLVSEGTTDGSKKPWKPILRAMFWSVATPSNACLILGLIWAAVGFDLPFLIDHITNIHRVAFMGAGIAVVGIYMFHYREYRPLIEAPVRSVLAVAMKLIIVPAVAFAWACVLGIDTNITVAIVLLHAMPLGFQAMEYAAKLEIGAQNFAATTFLALGMLFAWVAVLNELK
jgi:predicted permease